MTHEQAKKWLVWRNWRRIALLLSPSLAIVITDILRRGDRLIELTTRHRFNYFAAFVESVLVWGLLLYAASARRGASRWIAALLFTLFLTFSSGGQHYFYQQYNVYLTVDVSGFAYNFMDSAINQLFADIANYLKAEFPPLIFSGLLIFSAQRWVKPKRSRVRAAQFMAPLALVATFFIPVQHRQFQAATPDTLYLNAVGGVIANQLGLTEQSRRPAPPPRQSLPLAQLTSTATPARNIVFFILESVRADATCIEHDAKCQRTEHTNRLLPNRFPLTQMRSLASSTAISLAVLWTGVGPHESAEVLQQWPLIFDYAKAAGWDTAFWTSQNMMFGDTRLWVKNLGVSQFVSATQLDPDCDIDMGAPEALLAQRVNAEIDTLREPFLAVIQLSNAHYPYYVEEDGPQPFQPTSTSKSADSTAAFFNHYQNAVYQQDRHIAAIIEHIRARERGARTVIVHTSDHAEAFREHGQMGHTFSVLDEEIHVPAWLDAPPGILSEEQTAQLHAKKDAFTFHVDLTATLLDLMGVLDDPGLAPYQEKMLGRSLLRPELNVRPVPLTNCNELWSCAFENWGYMQGNLKLEARQWDATWHCFDLTRDPLEMQDLGEATCGELKPLALRTFGRLPGAQN